MRGVSNGTHKRWRGRDERASSTQRSTFPPEAVSNKFRMLGTPTSTHLDSRCASSTWSLVGAVRHCMQ